MRAKRALRVLVVIGAIVAAWPFARRAMRSPPARPDVETFEQAKRVRIVRDTWGVPHVFGKSDADAAFGLAYANAEDDWPTVQGVMAASSGHLGLLHASKTALANDYYVALVRVREQLDEGYDDLAPDYRAVLEAYARGLNLYAYLHPDESDGRLFPLHGRDVAAGFAHKVPLMFDLPDVLRALDSGPPKKVGDPILVRADDGRERRAMPGSNAHAVAASRSDDDTTRLNVNSHQPWEGPVTWYEAQVVSEEGWNMTGSLFPGAPIVLHGHNDHLGWAHTVNTPDLVDVYELPEDAKLETKQAPLTVDTGFFTITLHKSVSWAPAFGPVFEANGRRYAIRYAGMGHAIRAGEQWFRMNKATSFATWKSAMTMQAIPMFNTVYADHDNIYYVYNALIPVRDDPWNYEAVLPGDAPRALWTTYMLFESLPQVENPPSGFVQTCNSTPFATTVGFLENPSPDAFPRNAGIELDLTNRARRSLDLLGAPGPIGRERFLAMKWDRSYAPDARVFLDVVNPLLGAQPDDSHEREAIAILRTWDGSTAEDSIGATIAILTWRRVDAKHAIGGARGDAPDIAPAHALHETVQWLLANFGTVRVRWGDVQRLRRGDVDVPVGGGPDVLNAVLSRDAWDGRLVGYQGDSYVLEVEFGKDKTTSRSVHQYGASVRKGSPHYADQSRMYVAHELKPTLRDPAELAQHTERSYHPGDP